MTDDEERYTERDIIAALQDSGEPDLPEPDFPDAFVTEAHVEQFQRVLLARLRAIRERRDRAS